MSNATKFDDIDLMQYADGEVDDDTADGIAALCDSDPDALSKVESLDQMTEVMRSYLELAADDVQLQLDGMWAMIERRIQANGVSEERSVVKAKSAKPAREKVGILAAIGRFFDTYRGHFLTGAVAAGVAAALILALRPPAPAPTGPQAAEVQPAPVKDSPDVKLVKDEPKDAPNDEPYEPMDIEAPGLPEIKEIEVHGGSATIFMLPAEDENDVNAAVIFLDLDEDVEGPL